ncbi:unnamed protein product [Auanema sp. JU1783]|nr:unnamed protein product [Auanema sp. JU1783]
MPPKKGGKKNKDDDWGDDALEKKLAAVKLMEAQEKEDAAWDDESDDEPAPPPPPKANRAKAAFAMLMDDDDNSDKSESEPEAEPSPVKKPEPKKAEPKKEKAEKTESKNEKKKGKKGKKGNQEEEDELDAILANLDKPVEKEPTGKGKKKGAKAEQAPKEENLPQTGEVAAEESQPAQAEAAEGEAAAEDEGKKKKKKKKDKKKDGSEETEEQKEATPVNEEGDEGNAGEDATGEEATGDKKKKKKKKDKKEKKEGEDKPKKKSHVDMIKELLRAKKEAEEAEALRVQQEQDRIDQLEREREEQERIAREKREADKERKRLAILKQKEEGVYKTAKEKEKAKIAAAKFAAAGIDISTIGHGGPPPKPIVYMDKRTMKKQKQREAAKAAAEESKAEEAKNEADEKNDASQQAEEPLDDWEMADVEDIKSATPSEAAPAPKESTVKKVTKQPSAEKEESSEDDSSDDDSSSEEESSSEDEGPRGKETKEQIKERVKNRLQKRRETNEAKRSVDKLRAPVICVLGHVDTGKTKMLDTIRRTHVQEGEAGGITQQIGATRVPDEAIKERCRLISDFNADAMKLPGFLIIDTPGHESFSNLRSRGSSLCDFAILVVDLMHGLEAQTLESLKMLLKRETPFVIALNKIDRLYGYESNPRKDVYQHLKSQTHNTQMEFKDKCNQVIAQFAEQGLNVCLGTENLKDPDYIKMVPTSAMTGDGIGNLMSFIVNKCQTEHAVKLSFCEELDASVMEVKVISGLGTTADVILVNGYLRAGDILVLTGLDGAIITQVRDLLMPEPLKELRVKNEYERYKEVKGAQGIKLLARGLEKAVAGLPIFVAHNEDEVDFLKEKAELQLSKALTSIKKKSEGVYVMASTLGSLEALLEFLRTQKIPYSNVNIGPVHRKDVQKAAAMKEHNSEYACILAFDVKVERDAQIFADHEGVKIFQADIIYHLEDSFLKYKEDLRLAARKENEHKAIYPCKLKILPQHIFNARNPIVCGVNVEAGLLKRGTPICVPSKDRIYIGTVSSIQRNHEEVPTAKKGDEICIKIDNTTGEAPKLYGRHFNHEDILVSMITRDSIDVCKTYFRDDLAREDWQLVVELKKVLDIM